MTLELRAACWSHYLAWTGLGLSVHLALALALPASPARNHPSAAPPDSVWLDSSQAAPGPSDGVPGPTWGTISSLATRLPTRTATGAHAARRAARSAATSRRQQASGRATDTRALSAPADTSAATDTLPGATSAATDTGASSAAADASTGFAYGAGSGSGAGGAASGAHGPALRVTGSPCAGFFPALAGTDRGEVRIQVEVDAAGRPRASTVLAEHPHKAGFGSAARACAGRLHFSPAVDASGAPIVGHTKLKLQFNRPAAS